jgi:hypothetical protein
MSLIKVHNVETGEVKERQMSKDELAAQGALESAAEIQKQKELEALAAKTALLEKLGITEDEARLLLS